MNRVRRAFVGRAWFLMLLALGLLVQTPEVVVADVVVKEKVEGKSLYKVRFRTQPVIAVTSVHVAGTFTGWKKGMVPLSEKGGGVYEVELEIPPGRHEYKFVLNEQTWKRDESNDAIAPDGQGGFNSLVHVGPPMVGGPGTAGDGQVSMAAILHDPEDLNSACAFDGGRLWVLRLHVRANDVLGARVEWGPSGKASAGELRMERVASVAGRDVYEARLVFGELRPESLKYKFWLEDGPDKGGAPIRIDAATLAEALKAEKPGDAGPGEKKASDQAAIPEKSFELSLAKACRYETPEWARDAIFYQIFPDRYCNGDPTNDEAGLRKLEKRPAGRPYKKEDAYLEAWGARPSYFNFFGGDLKGIEAHLEDIQSLGINAIYLNPIFTAWSNHRYDAADYENVDPRLGTNDDFIRLCAKAKERGIRIILDCVFNHSGHRHYAFQDIIRKGPKSKYWKWYFVEGFPIQRRPRPNYKCWWDFPDLPQLNTANPEVVEHLLKVSTLWLDRGAAGWRLDVPNEVEEVNPKFWELFRQRVKAKHPDAYIVGEIWTDAAPWLSEKKFDATMNYPLRRALMDYVIDKEGDARRFVNALTEQYARLPLPAFETQFNLLGSHDTARILFEAKESKEKVRLAYGFLFCYVGAPVVYYGDELGLSGDKDPDCRACYPWEGAQDLEMRRWIQGLAKLRREEPALRRGLVREVLAEGKVAVLERSPATSEVGRRLWVAMNAGGSVSRVKLPKCAGVEKWQVIFGQGSLSGEADQVLELPASGLAVLAPAS